MVLTSDNSIRPFFRCHGFSSPCGRCPALCCFTHLNFFIKSWFNAPISSFALGSNGSHGVYNAVNLLILLIFCHDIIISPPPFGLLDKNLHFVDIRFSTYPGTGLFTKTSVLLCKGLKNVQNKCEMDPICRIFKHSILIDKIAKFNQNMSLPVGLRV